MATSNRIRTETGERLETYIKSRNITQDELAIQCNTSRQTVNNIINGKSSVTSEFLAKMSTVYYDLNLSWLITGIGNMTNSENQEGFDTRRTYTQESLIELLDQKDTAIEALKSALKSKDDIIEAQRELISLQKKQLDIL